ncbi:hypothetical protein [Micromonospora sp. NPDC049374]|uniref:YdeI/OmpD-associated family protein n=1 Tax=Micromonospora sp. NPDC049374 TaxID=3154352 RepID=UPI00342DC3B3
MIVPDADALRAWLSVNHATSPGVWPALTRKGSSVTTLTWQQAVDEALCFGWIDGQARKRDQERKIGEFVAMLARHETFHPQRARPQPAPD